MHVTYHVVPKEVTWNKIWFSDDRKLAEWLIIQQMEHWMIIKVDMYGERMIGLRRHYSTVAQLEQHLKDA